MIYMISFLFTLENLIFLYIYRNRVLRKVKDRLSMLITNSSSVIIGDEENSWYSIQYPLLVLHGASMGGYRYNNSKESIEQAILQGYKIIEIDIGITADNELVLTHRFSPDDEVIFDSRPNLNDFLSYGALEGETALTLRQFVKLCRETNVFYIIDCAHGIEDMVCDWMHNNVSLDQRKYFVFQVHTPELLKKIYEKKVFEHIHYNGTISHIRSIMTLLKTCNVHTCSISDNEIMSNMDSFKKLVESGLHPIVYTVNHTRRLKRILGAGASGIFSDRLQPNDIYNNWELKG